MKEYPWRYDKGKIGQKVFICTCDEKGNEFVDEDIIVEIQDNSYLVGVKDNGEFDLENIYRAETPENYSIGYWIKEYNPGHALYFGEDLFETKEEAEEYLENE